MLVVEHITDTGERVRTRGSLRPLDGHRQELAEAHVRIGYARAHAQARRGLDLAEALSTAEAAVVEAASRYDEAKAIPFPAYCDLVVRSKLAGAAAREARYATRHHQHVEDHQEDRAPDDRDPEPGQAAATAEMVDRLRRVLSPEVFGLLWAVFAEGRSLAEAGRDRGVSRQRAHQVVARALRRARQVCDRSADYRPAQ
jgi:DNA-directed RNA polymerase sigma subunit (sigma70/sigma32)